MNEIAFTLFCLCTICLVLTTSLAIYAIKVLERSRDIMSYTWDLLQKQNAERTSPDAYNRGYKAAVQEILNQYQRPEVTD